MTILETVFLLALLAKLAAETVLEALNRRQLNRSSSDFPEALAGVMNEEKLAKAQAYTRAKSRFATVALFWDAAVLAALVLSGLLPAAYGLWSDWVGVSAWGEALFLMALILASGIPSLPFEYVEQFRIEEKFGFNRSSVGLWLGDKAKGLALGLAIGFPILWLLISLVGWLGTYWWIYGFAIMLAFQLTMMAQYPMLIVPLFNKLTALEDGPLKERLMSLSDRAGFQCESIQVIDGSKRSGHSNAYFTGFGRFRRIVLYDTLIEQLGEEEIEAVLAHEIGHYKMGHIPKMIALSAVMLLAGFWLVGQLARSPSFFEGFGFEEPRMAIAFLLFSLMGGLFSFWLSPLFNLLSRKHEYEADAFARDAVKDWKPLSRALRRLSEENLSNLSPHPAYSGFHYSHPTLLEREAAMRGDA